MVSRQEVALFNSLSVHGQRLVAALAVVHEPLGERALLEWLKLLPVGTGAVGGRSKLPALEAEALGALLGELCDTGTIQALGSLHAPKYTVSTELAHAALSALREGEQLGAARALAMRRAPRIDPETRWLHRSRLVRDLLSAAHDGDGEEARAALRDLAATETRLEDPAQLLFDALGVRPPAHAVNGLLSEERDLYALRAIDEALDTLTPLGDELTRELRAQASSLSPALLSALGFYDALCQNPTLLEELARRPEPEAFGTRAFWALIQPNGREQARALAREAFELSRGANARRKGGVTGHAGPWLALLLLTARDTASLAQAEAQLDAAERRPELFGHATSYAIIRVLSHFFKKGAVPPTRGEAFDEFSESEAAWQRALLWSFVASASGATPPRGFPGALVACEERAREHGFVWLADELARARGNDREAGIRGLYAKQEPWEQLLSSLELAITQQADATDAHAEKARLRFLLEVDRRGRPTIGARIERLGASGYSVGRAIGWKRLREIALASDWISAEDLRVLRHVREAEPEIGATTTREYVLDDLAAWALVGHPRVFADEEATSPLEVLAATPRLDVHETLEGVRLKVHPSALGERRVVCVNEGNRRVRVYALNDAQWALASQCGTGGLTLPLVARDRLYALSGAFARHFELAAHVKLEGPVPEVDCDTRIHVQLVRAQSGLKIRLRVVPIAGGPSWLPGEGPEEVVAICVRATGPRAERTRRQLETERERAQAVAEACPSLRVASRSHYDFQLAELKDCLELLGELARLQDRVVVEWPEGQPLSVVAERDLKDLHLKLKQASYWLSAEGELVVDEHLKLSLKQLLDGVRQSEGRFLALSEGRFLALTQKLKRELEDLSVLSQHKDGQLELHPLSLGVLNRWGEELAQVQLDEPSAQSLSRLREAERLEVKTPGGLAADLRPYQLEGYAWLTRLTYIGAGACLADDMGLGKTLQALSLLVAHAERGPSLVVAPTSVTANWMEEAARFAPGLKAIRFAGDERERLVRELGPGDLLVCSYGMLQQGIELLERREFSVAVLDEAQAIKNPSTQRAKTAMRLRAQMRVALTGTPVENHLGELWSIMSFLNPGLLGSSRSFEQRFARPIQRESDAYLAESLKRVVHPFILRRKKSDVLAELPEKTVVTMRIPSSPEERALYAALREQALTRLRDPGRPGEVRLRMLAELMRMRRAACHPSLVMPEANIQGSKLEAFEELLRELREEGHRALVFSQFVDHLQIVRRKLEALSIPYQYLDGSTPPAQRAESVRAFQAGSGDVFLISLRAGGFGLNLTAADYVIHLDPWWNPAVEDQASDRAHRIGQTRPVTIYRLVMEGSIEEKILALHDEKRELADRLLEGSDTGNTLSVETLAALIREMGSQHDGARGFEASLGEREGSASAPTR